MSEPISTEATEATEVTADDTEAGADAAADTESSDAE
jgi:hypothetical protein